MFRSDSCGNTRYFIEGLETFHVTWGDTSFWCAPVIKCPICATFLEPRYTRGIGSTHNKIEYDSIDRSREIIDNRTKVLNNAEFRKLEPKHVWS